MKKLRRYGMLISFVASLILLVVYLVNSTAIFDKLIETENSFKQISESDFAKLEGDDYVFIEWAQDPQVLAELSALNASIMGAKHDPMYGAPTAVIVFADKTWTTGRQDAALVMGTLMLAAHACGLASCWINRAKEMFESPEGAPYRAKWGLGEEYEGMGICILGYEAEGGTVAAKPRKDDYIIRD